MINVSINIKTRGCEYQIHEYQAKVYEKGGGVKKKFWPWAPRRSIKQQSQSWISSLQDASVRDREPEAASG